VKLLKINGDDIDFNNNDVDIKQLKPDESDSIEIFMQAPSMKNEYFATFKLSFGYEETWKQEFGEKAILNISVKKPKKIKNEDFMHNLIELDADCKNQNV
jgi:hypothetical protein